MICHNTKCNKYEEGRDDTNCIVLFEFETKHCPNFVVEPLDLNLDPVDRTRIEFEKWYEGNWGSLERLKNGDYAYQIPQTA